MMNKIVMSDADLKNACIAIGRDILTSNWKPDYIVGINRGGNIPATMLSHFLSVPMYVLDVRLRDGTQSPETNLWMSEDAFGYAGPNTSYKDERKNILIVDDINDSGATFKWIKQDWESSCLPDSVEWNSIWYNSVKFATLFNNVASSEDVNFYWREINKAEEDAWIVFPWEEWWTN